MRASLHISILWKGESPSTAICTMSLKVAYLVNQYPKVSHSFIRREIHALEALGISVSRFSIRSCASELVDEADKLELQKTRFVLGKGVLGLLFGLMRGFFRYPYRFLRTLGLACKVGWRSEQGLLYHFAYLAEACVLLDWFAEAEIAHVHAHFGSNPTTVAMLCQALGGPSYSFTVHGPEEFDKVEAITLPEKIRRAAFVVAISSFGKSQLYRWCSLEHWAKIHLIHCGVDQSFLNQPYTAIPEAPRLVCVGRLCEDKGQMLLVQAVQQLAAEGLRFKLVLVGDGSLRPKLEDLIAAYQLTDYVAITGWATSAEVRQQLLDAQVMVLPSFAEGLPVVIMEALALGRPVISTMIAGIPELVQPGVSGWLVPAGSIEDLTTAMRTALQCSRLELEQLGKAGMRKVAQHHDVMTEASKLAKLFHLAAQSSSEESSGSQALLFNHFPVVEES